MIESQSGGIGRKLNQDDPRAPLTLKRLYRPAPDQVTAAMVGDSRCCQGLELLIAVWIGDVGMHEHVTGHLCSPSLLHCISSIRRARRPVHRASDWSTQRIYPGTELDSNAQPDRRHDRPGAVDLARNAWPECAEPAGRSRTHND